MTTEPQSPLSETEKRAAFLAELEAERQRRIEAGKWGRGVRPRLMAIPQAGETLQAAQQSALYGYLAEHPDALKTIAAYDWLEIEVIDPAPTIEPPGMQYAPDHADAVDVTPPPSPPPSTARSLPPPPGSVDPRNVSIPPAIHSAEQRRTQRFNDDDWGSPQDHPLRYPRGNRTGW
jgi:hypothetical protein